VQLELLSFHSAILSIERLFSTDVTLSEEQVAQLRSVYESCQVTIEEFEKHAMKYKPELHLTEIVRVLRKFIKCLA